MILESFIKDEGRLSALRQAIYNLESINAFGLFLEIGANRSKAEPNNHPIEYAALRAQWHEGYTEALNDIYNFFERYVPNEQQTKKMRPDFNAAQELLRTKEITEEEYAELTGSRFT